jgi:hypothetical protein
MWSRSGVSGSRQSRSQRKVDEVGGSNRRQRKITTEVGSVMSRESGKCAREGAEGEGMSIIDRPEAEKTTRRSRGVIPGNGGH